jgi:hypothetical protein
MVSLVKRCYPGKDFVPEPPWGWHDDLLAAGPGWDYPPIAILKWCNGERIFVGQRSTIL